jgi:hypothetical protein
MIPDHPHDPSLRVQTQNGLQYPFMALFAHILATIVAITCTQGHQDMMSF